MKETKELVFPPVDGLDAVFEAADRALPMRKIESALQRTNLTADAKAFVLDLSSFTVRIGKAILELGRIIVSFVLKLVKAFPHMTFGIVLSAVLWLLINSLLGGLPLIGAAIAGFLNVAQVIFNISHAGYREVASGDLSKRIDSLIEELSPLKVLGDSEGKDKVKEKRNNKDGGTEV